MKCLERGIECERLTNRHPLQCSGMALREYRIRHQPPLGQVLHPVQVNRPDSVDRSSAASMYTREAARAALRGLRWVRIRRTKGDSVEISGDIRRPEMLLWDLERLAGYGFRYCQEFEVSGDTRGVGARDRLRAPLSDLRPLRRRTGPQPPPAFLDSLAVYVAHQAGWHAGCLYMPFPSALHGEDVRHTLARHHGIHCQVLDAADHPGSLLLRTRCAEDGDRLLGLLAERLRAIPAAGERFFEGAPQATVSMEPVFGAARFFRDHPARCSNLRRGRYLLQVEVSDRIDPVTGNRPTSRRRSEPIAGRTWGLGRSAPISAGRQHPPTSHGESREKASRKRATSSTGSRWPVIAWMRSA